MGYDSFVGTELPNNGVLCIGHAQGHLSRDTLNLHIPRRSRRDVDRFDLLECSEYSIGFFTLDLIRCSPIVVRLEMGEVDMET